MRKEKEHKSNQGKTKKALCGVCGGENKHMEVITESNLCVVVFGYKHSPLGESKHSALGASFRLIC